MTGKRGRARRKAREEKSVIKNMGSAGPEVAAGLLAARTHRDPLEEERLLSRQREKTAQAERDLLTRKEHAHDRQAAQHREFVQDQQRLVPQQRELLREKQRAADSERRLLRERQKTADKEKSILRDAWEAGRAAFAAGRRPKWRGVPYAPKHIGGRKGHFLDVNKECRWRHYCALASVYRGKPEKELCESRKTAPRTSGSAQP